MENYNPLDNGKAFNEQPEAGFLPDITQQENLNALDRIQALVNKTKELINE